MRIASSDAHHAGFPIARGRLLRAVWGVEYGTEFEYSKTMSGNCGRNSKTSLRNQAPPNRIAFRLSNGRHSRFLRFLGIYGGVVVLRPYPGARHILARLRSHYAKRVPFRKHLFRAFTILSVRAAPWPGEFCVRPEQGKARMAKHAKRTIGCGDNHDSQNSAPNTTAVPAGQQKVRPSGLP
jgi:hypothetical protein